MRQGCMGKWGDKPDPYYKFYLLSVYLPISLWSIYLCVLHVRSTILYIATTSCLQKSLNKHKVNLMKFIEIEMFVERDFR